MSTPSVENTMNIKINYIRYADDFIIGVTGPKSLAKDIYKEVDSYLKEIELNLNKEKTLLTDFTYNPIKFLGTLRGNPKGVLQRKDS